MEDGDKHLSPRRYLGYWLWPVLDFDGSLEYWDVHEPDDSHGEGDPVAFGFGAKEDATEWVRNRVKEDRLFRALDRWAQ